MVVGQGHNLGMKRLFLLLALFSASTFAQTAEDELLVEPNPETTTPVMTTRPVEEDKDFKVRKGHWLSSFGFEGIKYQVPGQFEGVKKNFRDRTQEMYGTRIGLGRELHIGAGLMTTTKIEGFYLGTLFTKSKTADPEIENEKFYSAKVTGQLLGGDISQSISYLFDFKTYNPMGNMTYLTLEPFVEIGIGYAEAYNKVKYLYDTSETGSIGTPGAPHEWYRHGIKDIVSTRKLAAGFNIISNEGYFFFTKVSQMQFANIARHERGYKKQNETATVDKLTFSDEKPDVINTTAFSIGGGYKF